MNRIEVKTKQTRFPVAKNLYGLFFEDINRSADGGLYPEMLRNRSFEDSIPPGGCTLYGDDEVYVNRGGWPDIFCRGEGMIGWAKSVPETPVPAWYGDRAGLTLRREDTLNQNRLAALRVDFKEEGALYNIGFAGVPVKKGESYDYYAFIKADGPVGLTLSLESADGQVCAQCGISLSGSEQYIRYDAVLVSRKEDFSARFVLRADRACAVTIGFCSLMPQDTFRGHGLRKDLAQLLADTHSKFLRFPGGCVVEGFNLETAMRFPHTIGPVWERPSHNLMWHYRTSNGLGFHEYLQLCEDLELEPMYVCNCGMSCQARVEELFDESLVETILRETLGAIEYAVGPANSRYGAVRAAMGHPAPFKMTYLEIGNENWGPAYNERYEKFYHAIKAKYPQIVLISNTHTERDGLPTEVADEHYYNTPAFFAENAARFDGYDRSGPEIFLGEYAVNGGETISSMECAAAEAFFLTGVERNQDIVTLSAYAPLLQNVNYSAWRPNLIAFDNHGAYGIPTYHMLSMMAQNRGKEVVEVHVEVEEDCPAFHGIPGLLCEKPGLQFRNAKVNGRSVGISRTVYGAAEQNGEVFTTREKRGQARFTYESALWAEKMESFQKQRMRQHGAPDTDGLMYFAFGEADERCYTFEIDLKFDPDNPVTLSVWNYHPETDAGVEEPKDFGWNLFSVTRQVWGLYDGTGVTEDTRYRMRFRQQPDKPRGVKMNIDYTRFNTYKIVTRPDGYDCYINHELVQSADLRKYPAVAAAASVDGDTVIVKIVNISGSDKDVEVSFDCDVAARGQAQVLSGPPDAVNTLDDPERVSVKGKIIPDAAKRFTYGAPACSVSVLRLKKA